jgi:hypothetical protein
VPTVSPEADREGVTSQLDEGENPDTEDLPKPSRSPLSEMEFENVELPQQSHTGGSPPKEVAVVLHVSRKSRSPLPPSQKKKKKKKKATMPEVNRIVKVSLVCCLRNI